MYTWIYVKIQQKTSILNGVFAPIGQNKYFHRIKTLKLSKNIHNAISFFYEHWYFDSILVFSETDQKQFLCA
jgi:hypothetical protein